MNVDPLIWCPLTNQYMTSFLTVIKIYSKISISDMCTPKPDSIISVPAYKNFGFKRSPNSRLDSVSVSDFIRAYQIAQSKIYFLRTSCEMAGPGCSVQVFYRSVIRASNPLLIKKTLCPFLSPSLSK